MKKLYIVYISILVILAASFVLVKKAYNDWAAHSTLTRRANNLLITYQELARHIVNAAVVTQQLTDAKKTANTTSIFSTNKSAIPKSLATLTLLVRDSVNIKIANQLTNILHREQEWIYHSNIPDSIIHHKAPQHIAAIDSIHLLIEQGIDRTRFVYNYSEKGLTKRFDRVVLLLVVSLAFCFLILLYTIYRLFKSQEKEKRKDGQLIQKDVQFRHILDNILEGVQIHDFNWRYTYVNKALAKYSKVPEADLLGAVITDKYPGMAETELFKTMDACMKNRTSKHLETEFVFPDGSKGFFELSIQPVPEGLFILSINRTEQQKAKLTRDKSIKDLTDLKFALDQAAIIATTNQKGIIKHVNDNFCKITKYDYEDLIGQHIRVVHSCFHDTDYIKDMWDTLEGGSIWKGEIKNLAKDGTYHWADTTIVPFLNKNGKPYQFLSISYDITARKDNDEKLKKTSRMFAFLSAINQSIVHSENEQDLLDRVSKIATDIGRFKLAFTGLLDPDHKLRIASIDGAKESVEQILKMDGLDVNNPLFNDTPTVKVLKSGECNFNNDLQNDPSFTHWKDEFIRHGVHSNISLPITKFGVPIGVLGFHAGSKDFFDTDEIALLQEAAGDISFSLENFDNKRKHLETEELMLKNEKRFRRLIEKSKDFKTLTDKDGRLTYANPSVVKAFGFPMEEFLNIPATSFFHPDDAVDLVNKRNAILDIPGASYSFEYRIGHKNGQWIWCEGTVTNFLHDPALQALVSNFRDISEKRKDILEKETLIKQLTQNNHDLRQFAYITSHNLRGPVANLLGLTNLLDTLTIEDPTLLQILKGIKTATVMFDETLKDLANVLTVRDNVAIQMETIRFEDSFEKVKLFCEKSITDSEASIHADFSESPEISFNKAYLESIFINLLSNAIKYRDERRPLIINVKTYAGEDTVTLRFSDNGIGFDSEMQKDKVFKLYQRFHVHKEGKGLGLFLMKSQLDALGGGIQVDSKPNEGSTFTIQFNTSQAENHDKHF